jgi:hypothetical protein
LGAGDAAEGAFMLAKRLGIGTKISSRLRVEKGLDQVIRPWHEKGVRGDVMGHRNREIRHEADARSMSTLGQFFPGSP